MKTALVFFAHRLLKDRSVFKKIGLSCLLLFIIGLLNTAQAHEVPPEVLEFLAAHPDATQDEFTQFFAERDLLEDLHLWDEDEGGDGVNFTLPKKLIDYLLENPQATKADTQQFILADPVLSQTDIGHNIEAWLENESSDYRFSVNDLVLLKQLEKPEIRTINWGQFAINYIRLGVEHILIGLDHILFVISLVLVLAPWRKILKMVTIFTLAHSVTLILAGTDVLKLSAHIVEPIIALSIAYMAITTVFLKSELKHKHWGIFIFGLFHGLGFAGVFSDYIPTKAQLIPSLLFFNVGVELGQIFILGLTLPVIYLIYKFKANHWVIPMMAIGVSVMAIWWTFERVFF